MFRTLPAYYRSLPKKLSSKLVEIDGNGASRDEIAKAMSGASGLSIGMLFS
ncbi:hypothetical protein [Terribacillus saccharophilus]|uniref:hypothetical protein n=1 Tax=Terribacillus saccharophilus TaxID=361277 RepID=UPI0020D0F20B|nr:hypothetical protein [Terribacillus saccharophilus]